MPEGQGPLVPAASPLPRPGEDSIDAAVLARTAADLERFSQTLSPREQAAMDGLLALAGGGSLVLLANEPARSVLEPDEQADLEHLRDRRSPAGLKGRSSVVVVMKATRLCNLRCTYCHFWSEGPNQVMRFPVLARATFDALRIPDVRHVEFVWHGGETTLLGPSFYRKALWLQEQFRQPGQVVRNFLQTNGTRLTPSWVEFLTRYGFSVGVSLDGPPEVHDRRRIDAAGRPTAARVRAGLRRLQTAGVDHGVLMVVDDELARLGARRVLDYLLDIGVSQVGVLNVIPENAAEGVPVQGSYLPWHRYVAWLRDLFACWWPEHADRIVVRELADLLGQVKGMAPETCFFAGDCHGRYLTVEPDGAVAACDKYIGDPAFQLGHVGSTTLAEITDSPRLAAIQDENRRAVGIMRDCPWFAVCHGGCPHDRRLNERYVPDHDGRCCGLAPLLEDMADAVSRSGRPRLIPAAATTGIEASVSSGVPPPQPVNHPRPRRNQCQSKSQPG